MKINEIFYSLQGEGTFTGTAAVFIRTSGCNLKCSFCDTKHEDGKEMTIDEITRYVCQYPCTHVVVTGGEPSLQKDLEALIDALHRTNHFVQVETNGTKVLPANVDWITCSPKNKHCAIKSVNELKVVYEHKGQDMSYYDEFTAGAFYLQPCDVQDAERNTIILLDTIDYIKAHPTWKLSLQTQKIANIQ